MHLFIVHQFPDYDNFVPIIINLKKKVNSKFAIMNIFPVHDLKYYRFNSLLKKYEIQFIDIGEINIRSILINLLLSFVKIFPNAIIIKMNRVWHYFYHRYVLFNKNHIISLIKKKDIKSISIDHGLPARYKKIFYVACKETNIKYNCYILGVQLDVVQKTKSEDFNLYDYAMIQSQILGIDDSEKNKRKFKRIASPRYSLDWLNEVEEMYRYKLKEYSPDTFDRKLKVVLMTRAMFSEKTWQILYEELKKINNIELKIKLKPRGQFRPLYTQKNIINEYNTSELINWADVIVSHTSSILNEAIIKNKKILFLNFLFDLEKQEKCSYAFEDLHVVTNVNSKEDLVMQIENLKTKQTHIMNDEKYQESKKIYLKKVFGDDYFDKKDIYEKNFINIYQN
jgi:hypothetical protein